MSKPFDPDKDAKNTGKHQISLDRASEMDVRRRLVDDRVEYGEVRIRAWGYIDGKPYRLVYTMRDGEPRPISLHRVHKKEMKRYVEET